MIIHFIKNDFYTCRVYWIILTVVSAVVLPLALIRDKPLLLFFMAYGYFLFAAGIAGTNLTGVTWRSQRIMSRNYLLSLPVKRKSLFLVIQFRALIFWLPFLIIAFLLPLKFLPPLLTTATIVKLYFIYTLMLLAGALWVINFPIRTQLIVEKITTYLNQKQRAIETIVLFIIFISECFIVGFCFLSFFLLSSLSMLNPLLPFFVILIFGFYRFFTARKNWICQQ